MNNKEAFEFLSQSENNVRHATREMLERYSIPEGDTDIWRRKFANQHNARRSFIKNKDLITWEEQTFHQVTLPRKLEISESIALTEYCREEFEKFTTFLTSKKCRNWPVFG